MVTPEIDSSTVVGTTTSPPASLIPIVTGMTLSVKFVVSLVLGFELSVNFSAKTSEMSFCASVDSCADETKLTLPWPLTMVWVPA
jgi:hypothetical protein